MADPKETEYELADGVTEDGAPEIVVEDDTPEQDRNRTPSKEAPAEVTDEELTKYSDQKLKDRLAHLGKGYHDERRAKEAALREREEAVRVAQAVVEENKRLQGSLSTNQTALVEQAKRVVQSEIDDAKRKLAAAQDAFDTAAIVEAQSELTKATIRAERVNNFKPTPVQPLENVVQPRHEVQPAVQLDPKTRSWQEQNPWFGADRKMTAYALSVHEDLVESGISPTSDTYYERIDKDMKKRFPEAFAGDAADADRSPRSRSNVAPATRSTAPKKVVLTQSQVNIAKRLGVSLEAYARSVAELRK